VQSQEQQYEEEEEEPEGADSGHEKVAAAAAAAAAISLDGDDDDNVVVSGTGKGDEAGEGAAEDSSSGVKVLDSLDDTVNDDVSNNHAQPNRADDESGASLAASAANEMAACAVATVERFWERCPDYWVNDDGEDEGEVVGEEGEEEEEDGGGGNAQAMDGTSETTPNAAKKKQNGQKDKAPRVWEMLAVDCVWSMETVVNPNGSGVYDDAAAWKAACRATRSVSRVGRSACEAAFQRHGWGVSRKMVAANLGGNGLSDDQDKDSDASNDEGPFSVLYVSLLPTAPSFPTANSAASPLPSLMVEVVRLGGYERFHRPKAAKAHMPKRWNLEWGFSVLVTPSSHPAPMESARSSSSPVVRQHQPFEASIAAYKHSKTPVDS